MPVEPTPIDRVKKTNTAMACPNQQVGFVL